MSTRDLHSGDDWWREASIYQVYPRSFQDSDGDGEGDLRGVISRLDHLEMLGVDAIWLSPFYKSPNRDGGYDVSDPRAVDPRFGNLADAKDLLHSAHARGIKVIVDIVPNHFSSDHEWFRDALKASPGSNARGRFHFRRGRGALGDLPPNNWSSLFGGPAWTYVPGFESERGEWYLHLFDASQPDLNWDHPDVIRDFDETLRFWIELGVDGFRVDVAHGLVKGELDRDHRDPEGLVRALRADVTDISPHARESLLVDIPFFDQPGVHQIYRRWRSIIDSYPVKRMMVAEAWVYPSSRVAAYVRPDELHQVFNFDFMTVKWDQPSIEQRTKQSLAEMSTVGAMPTWTLSNHDSPRVVTRLGGGESGRRRARALALFTHALPGSVYVYQGEELGLEDVLLPDEVRQDPVFFRTKGMDKGRDGARVPMPWDNTSPNFGFTTGTPWLPMPAEWANELRLSEEGVLSRSENDFHKQYRESLMQRKNFSATSMEWLEIDGLIAFNRGAKFTCLLNVNPFTIEVPSHRAGSEIVLSSAPDTEIVDDRLKISAESTAWLRVR